jgi:hypothetical protein
VVSKFVSEEMKNEGRVNMIRKKRSEGNENNQQAKRLKDLTYVSSGTLASIGCHRLGCELRDKVSNNIKSKQQQQQQKEARTVERASSHSMKYKAVQQKVLHNQSLLTADMKLLLKKHHQSNHSPLRKTAKEIREQWENRKGRIFLEVQLQNYDNVTTCTSNENADDDFENNIFSENSELDLLIPDVHNLPDSILQLERENSENLFM